MVYCSSSNLTNSKATYLSIPSQTQTLYVLGQKICWVLAKNMGSLGCSLLLGAQNWIKTTQTIENSNRTNTLGIWHIVSLNNGPKDLADFSGDRSHLDLKKVSRDRGDNGKLKLFLPHNFNPIVRKLILFSVTLGNIKVKGHGVLLNYPWRQTIAYTAVQSACFLGMSKYVLEWMYVVHTTSVSPMMGCWRFSDPRILGVVAASQQTFFIVSGSHSS